MKLRQSLWRTPALVAHLTDHVWSLEDIIGLLFRFSRLTTRFQRGSDSSIRRFARMQQNTKDFRWLRVTGALLLGLILLMALLPNTGGVIAGSAPDPKMWRCGPFSFYPSAFFGVVGTIAVLIACTVFGIVRRNFCEVIGWILIGIVFICVFFA